MSWSGGANLLAEIVEATWPLIEEPTSYADRVDWLTKLIDLFADQDADFCPSDWAEDPWAEEFAEAYSDIFPDRIDWDDDDE